MLVAMKLAEMLRQQRAEEEAAIAKAEREAEAAGKEPFDLAHLEALLGEAPGGLRERERSLRRSYYLFLVLMRTLAEFAELQDHWYLSDERFPTEEPTMKTRDRLSYEFGNEHNPTNPMGRCVLTLEPAGTLRLDHCSQFDPQHRAWTARVDAAVVERVWAGLDRAAFPAMPQHIAIPDQTIRMLSAEGDGEPRSVHIAWDVVEGLPGYEEAFALLDQIVRQASEGTLEPVPAGEPGLVTGVVRVE